MEEPTSHDREAPRTLHVLLVEDSAADAELLAFELRRAGFDPLAVRVETEEGLRNQLGLGGWALVLSDCSLPSFSATGALRVVKELAPELPFVVVSGTVGEEAAAALMRAGASDFVLKDNLGRVGTVTRRVLAEADARSARMAAEAALQVSQERYRRFFEEDLTGDYAASPEGGLLACNPAFARMLGFASVDDALAAALHEVFEPEAPFASLVEELRREGRVEYQQRRLLRQDGTAVHVVQNAVASFGPSGELNEVYGYLFDAGPLWSLEEQLRHAQRMEAVGTFAGGVAHDFANLLQAMLSVTQILEQSATDFATRETAAELTHLARHGATLTRQLLLFSRRAPAQREVLDLHDLIRETAVMLRRLVPKNVRLDLAPSEGPLVVEADRGQLEQVVVNLVVNARDAMPEGGTVSIRTGCADEAHAWLEVADTGHGMTPDVRDRLFEPFFTTKPHGHGTGLGLAVVKGIVEAHEGRVEVTSTPGQGSRFLVILPACSPALETDPPIQSEAPVPQPAESADVLLVEDDDGVRKGLHVTLEHLGCRVTSVATGAAAESVPDQPGFTVLITDYLLPDTTGPELAQRLGRRWPDLKVILMSGYSESDTLPPCAHPPGVRFLQKPFDTKDLVRALRAVLGRAIVSARGTPGDTRRSTE